MSGRFGAAALLARARARLTRGLRCDDLLAARSRIAELELQAKDNERAIVNLVAALRQANARVLFLEEFIAVIVTDRELAKAGLAEAPRETVN